MFFAKYDVTLTIGHNVQGVSTWSQGDVVSAAYDTLGTDGLTAYDCLGYWRGESEESTRIEICAVGAREARRIRDAVPDLARRLGQVEIMVQVTRSHARFVKAA